MTIEAASDKVVAKNIAIDGATALTTTLTESTPLNQPLVAAEAPATAEPKGGFFGATESTKPAAAASTEPPKPTKSAKSAPPANEAV